MGKNKRRQIPFKDTLHNVEVLCDSTEECDFMEWCIEAAQLGIVKDFVYQPPSITLSEPIDYVAYDGKKRSLFREHVYSPDFTVEVDPQSSKALCKAFKLPFNAMALNSFQVYLDVKGTFQRGDGGRAFSINQKWVYQKTGTYIVKIVPKDFFAVCGCPQACFKTRKTNKVRKAYAGLKSIEEALHC